MLEKIPRDVALWCWPCLVTKLSHMGVNVDGLPCTILRPTTARRGDKASCQASSCPRAWIFVRVLTAWVPGS
jgi:hypothetical protein